MSVNPWDGAEALTKINKRWLPWLAVILVAIGFVNFFIFWTESMALGGDALNGHVTNGHYFLASHGSYTEVSQTVWTLSLIHAVATFVSWPFVMLAMAFLLLRVGFPFMTGGRAPGNTGPRVDAICASGDPIWTGSPGGRVGGLRASIGMLQVVVYPAGIVANIRFSSTFAIYAEEIRSVRLGRAWMGFPTIEIEHEGVDVTSPLVVYGSRSSPQAEAISQLVESTGAAVGAAAAVSPPIAMAGAIGITVVATDRPDPPGPLRALSILGRLGSSCSSAASYG
jgi:hypothetical protein